MSKVAIQGNASGTGTLTIAAQNTNSNYTLTIPNETGNFITTGSSGQVIPLAALPKGAVLQVVNSTFSNEVTSTSGSYADVGLSATITPTSATSKILVMINTNGLSTNAASTTVAVQVLRGATPIFVTDNGAAYQAGDNDSAGSGGIYLDSPATTSATTYKAQFKRGTGSGTAKVNHYSTTSFLTLMEIAA